MNIRQWHNMDVMDYMNNTVRNENTRSDIHQKETEEGEEEERGKKQEI